MNLARLKNMGITEIAYRSRQEASKWLERVGVNRDVPLHARDGHADLSVLLARDLFREMGPRRFFAGAARPETAKVASEKMAHACGQTIAAAEEICRGRFDLLGYRGLWFGAPIDWHLDPVSGRASPPVHWSRVKSLDPAMVGDSKVVWELNRHQWLIHLGIAYRLTGDARYAEAFAVYLVQWMQANPPGVGINWASSLEAALRIVSWSWALSLFRDSDELSPELFASMLEGISQHAAHVEKYLSYYFAPNTHLTGEALGLFYAGVLFPELPSAGRWRDLGAEILVEQSGRQILPDGVYFEQSTCYQRYTAEIYLHFLILAGRNGLAVPNAVRGRVERLMDFLVAVRRPDGSVPQIGDGDGGWLAPLAIRQPDDFRGVFSVAAAFFRRADYAWGAGGPTPESLWLLGTAGLKSYQRLEPAPPETARSRVFADGGYVVMRSSWRRDAHHLIFDVGPVNAPTSGHGHADLLSIQCSAFGEPYIVDPGTYCYTPEPEWRNFFRGAWAHSTVTVDGLSQAVPAGPFNWQTHPRARLGRWLSTEAYDFADAAHDAYGDLHDPIVHRRRLIFVKPRYWVIVDDIEGGATHRVELRFQFAPMKVAIEPDHWVRARGQRGQALLVRPFATVPFRLDLVEGNVATLEGWISPNYGERLPAPVLIWSAAVRLPLRVMTLLFPIEHPSAPCPDVLQLLSPIGPSGLIFRRDHERIIVRDDNIVVLKQN
jgi:hypothetical protein